MTCYVTVQRLNGRRDFYNLATILDARGFGDRVEYYSGSVAKDGIDTIRPHLKFKEDEDALAYILAYGGEISKEMPSYSIERNEDFI